MIKKNKLIENMDDQVWVKFTGHCKAKGVKVGDELADILSDYLKEV
jgi:hypothetical protein